MINVNEKLMNLKASVFDNSENVKAYSVRLPLTLSANVDGIATYSGKSRNLILIDLVNLGLAYFIENLSETENTNWVKQSTKQKRVICSIFGGSKIMLQMTGMVVNLFTKEGGKDKEGKEYEPTHKVQILGAVDFTQWRSTKRISRFKG